MINICKTISVRGRPDLNTVEKLCIAIKQAGGKFDEQKIKKLMINPAFAMLSQGCPNIDLNIIALEQQLGCENKRLSMGNIYNAAGQAGLTLCSGRTGIELYLQLLDNQTRNDRDDTKIEESIKELIIAMNPIMDYCSNDFVMLKITCDDDYSLCLEVCPVPYDKIFLQDSFLWVFRGKTK